MRFYQTQSEAIAAFSQACGGLFLDFHVHGSELTLSGSKAHPSTDPLGLPDSTVFCSAASLLLVDEPYLSRAEALLSDATQCERRVADYFSAGLPLLE